MNFLKHVALLQPVAIFREGRRVPYAIIGRKTDKPAIKQVIVQLFHQLPLRTNAVAGLQQQGAHQLFRWDRWPPFARIELAKCSAQILQDFPHERPYLPQRMIGSGDR